MIQEEITIAGKKVNIAYCYATEIAYMDLTGEELPPFVQQAAFEIQEKRTPTVKNVVFAIVASIMPCYQNSVEAPVKDIDIMNDASPEELGMAIGTIIKLFAGFYHLPIDDKDKSDDDGSQAKKGKKRKNS